MDQKKVPQDAVERNAALCLTTSLIAILSIQDFFAAKVIAAVFLVPCFFLLVRKIWKERIREDVTRGNVITAAIALFAWIVTIYEIWGWYPL